MKSRVLLIGLLAVAGLLAAAGITVAAGEVVSRPIGLNGNPDDLGRSLTPDAGQTRTVIVRRTVTVRKKGRPGKNAGGGASQGSYSAPSDAAPTGGSGRSSGGSSPSSQPSRPSGGGSGDDGSEREDEGEDHEESEGQDDD